MGLTKDAILKAGDLKQAEVAVPEWGGSVKVREMSAAGVLSFWDACRDSDGKMQNNKVQAELLVRSVIDDSGNPMFSAEDIEQLMGKSAKAIARVFAAAQSVNGMGEEKN